MKIEDNKVFKEIKIALSGKGKLWVNYQTRHLKRKLMKKYELEEDELAHFVFIYIIDRSMISSLIVMNRLNNRYTSIKTFITYTTFYVLSNLERKLKKRHEYIKYDTNYTHSRQEVLGVYARSVIDNASDNKHPENILIKKELLKEVVKYMGKIYVEAVIGTKIRSECAKMLGYEYKYFCKVLQKKLTQTRKHLTSMGYQPEDLLC